MGTGLVYEGTPGVRVKTPSITIVGATSEGVVAAALDLVRAGATRLELCGGLGPLPQAEVQAAVGDGVPVGAVMYGFESLEATTDFKRRFADGETPRAAFLYLDQAADPSADRVDHPDGLFAAVPDDETAGIVAGQLVDAGVTLLELYGGLGVNAVKRIHESTNGRLAIGIALYQGSHAVGPAPDAPNKERTSDGQ